MFGFIGIIGSAVIFLVFNIPKRKMLEARLKTEPEAVRIEVMHIIQKLFTFFRKIGGYKVIVTGQENIPEDRAVLFIGNHRSDFDILTTYLYMKRPTGYIAKKTFQKIPLMNKWMDLVGCLYLDRENLREGLKTILAAIELVKTGHSIFVFPEGTRNKNEDPDTMLNEFKEGCFKIASKTGCEIVPVAIRRTEYIFEKQKPCVRPETVYIEFGKPYRIEDIPEERRKKPGEYTRSVIIDMIAEMKKTEI